MSKLLVTNEIGLAEVLASSTGIKSALEVFLYYYLSAHEIFKKAIFLSNLTITRAQKNLYHNRVIECRPVGRRFMNTGL